MDSPILDEVKAKQMKFNHEYTHACAKVGDLKNQINKLEILLTRAEAAVEKIDKDAQRYADSLAKKGIQAVPMESQLPEEHMQQSIETSTTSEASNPQ